MRRTMMKNPKMWIGGAWRTAESNQTRDVVNPTDQSVIAQVPEAGPKDVSEAVASAREAFDHGPWRNFTARDRGTLLWKVAGAIRERAQELAELDARNMGKPIVEAEYDVQDAAHCFEYYAGIASKIHGETRRCPTTPCRW